MILRRKVRDDGGVLHIDDSGRAACERENDDLDDLRRLGLMSQTPGFERHL